MLYNNRHLTIKNRKNEEEQIYTVKYEDYTYFIERINKLYTEKTIPIFFRNDINIIEYVYN